MSAAHDVLVRLARRRREREIAKDEVVAAAFAIYAHMETGFLLMSQDLCPEYRAEVRASTERLAAALDKIEKGAA